jgi:hypothetical protein
MVSLSLGPSSIFSLKSKDSYSSLFKEFAISLLQAIINVAEIYHE